MSKRYTSTKFTITVNYDLKSLKKACQRYYGKQEKITKKDVAFLLQGFAEADIQDFVPSIKEEDKNDEL